MNYSTRWEVYNPFAIGFEDTFRRLDAFASGDKKETAYPPFNIIRVDEEVAELEMALAGFSKEDIQVSVQKGILNIKATRKKDTELNYSHRGLAFRNVNKNWQLSETAVVDGVKFVDGLLTVTLRLELPEDQKKKVFDIG